MKKTKYEYKEYGKSWREANKERLKPIQNKWYLDNRERLLTLRKLRYENNKEQHKLASKAWALANPGRIKELSRSRNLQRNFGLTTEDYNAMLNKQLNRCDICNRHKTDFKQALSVDHCHATGKIRALLCHNCNKGIGLFKENTAALLNAVAYLKRHSEKT